ncbi:MAG TPA: SAM-dependent methyltransferase [Gammaproteobacteria bacterium]|jgi:methyltransferase (TIGR00027 family)|nr:SAM-dependent methyltransferase [Gammaproteobacteria bacterium]
MSEPAIRNVSDTALWVAVYRAQESERPDPLFYDPYARQLAGERGEEIAKQVGMPGWPIVVRTQILDELILKAVEEDGFDTVLNLAAGLDTRPYRLALPATLRWIEVDLAPMVEYKRDKLKEAKCFCRLERHAVDLADPAARRALFAKVGAAANKVLVITEGLLVYLDPEEVKALAADLHQPVPFKRWLLDIASPQLLEMLAKRGMTGDRSQLLENQEVRFRFAPAESLDFFAPLGWRPMQYRSVADEARRLKRFEIPLPFKVMGFIMGLLLPPVRRRLSRMSGIGVLERA